MIILSTEGRKKLLIDNATEMMEYDETETSRKVH